MNTFESGSERHSHHNHNAQERVHKSRQLRGPLAKQLHGDTDTVELEDIIAHYAEYEHEKEEVVDGGQLRRAQQRSHQSP